MKGKRLFLYWALFVSLMCVGTMFAANLGWLASVFHDDPTHITYVTVSVLLVATGWCGWLSWRLSNGEDPREVDKDLDHGFYAARLCFYIGLIGTAIGYLIMLKNGAAAGDPSQVIRQAFANTAIAIVNTIFGIVCSVLVEAQSHFIERAIVKMLPPENTTPEKDEES
jgi:hypothetical protein